MRWLPLLLAITAATSASAEITFQRAFAADASGNAITPTLGQPFYLNVQYTVSAQKSAYQIAIDAPSGKLTASNLKYGVGQNGPAWICWGQITPLFDGSFSVTVSSPSAKKPLVVTITPASSAKAIEFYDPRNLVGSHEAHVTLKKAVSQTSAWSAIPDSAGNQVVSSVDTSSDHLAFSSTSGQMIQVHSALNSAAIDIKTTVNAYVKAVRVNATQLRTVPFSALASVAAENAAWLKSETLIESTNSKIVSFAATALKPATAKKSVYDAALALYQAVLVRSQYKVTGKTPDALSALNNGYGECGDLSALFVAACRASGIPARPVSGYVVGSDSWHVWAAVSEVLTVRANAEAVVAAGAPRCGHN